MAHPGEIVGAPRWMVSNKFHREGSRSKYDIEIKRKKKITGGDESSFSNGLIVQKSVYVIFNNNEGRM